MPTLIYKFQVEWFVCNLFETHLEHAKYERFEFEFDLKIIEKQIPMLMMHDAKL